MPATSFKFDVRIELHVFDVNFEDLFAPADVGSIDEDMAIKAAGPQERGVERLGTVRGRHDDDAVVGTEAVHFDEQGIERLLAFVVAAHQAVAAALAERVEFIDEDDARRLGFGLLEHVANAGGADADEHFDKVRTRQAKNGTPASPAMALASSVLPVPGGPTSSTPLGMRPPRR